MVESDTESAAVPSEAIGRDAAFERRSVRLAETAGLERPIEKEAAVRQQVDEVERREPRRLGRLPVEDDEASVAADVHVPG